MKLRKGLLRIGRSERDERLKISSQENAIARKIAEDAFELHKWKIREITESELYGLLREAIRQQHYASVRAPEKVED